MNNFSQKLISLNNATKDIKLSEVEKSAMRQRLVSFMALVPKTNSAQPMDKSKHTFSSVFGRLFGLRLSRYSMILVAILMAVVILSGGTVYAYGHSEIIREHIDQAVTNIHNHWNNFHESFKRD